MSILRKNWRKGRYYLQELTPADGYLADRQEKSIYLRRGSATEVRWENTAVKGQIQIIKKSADYNPVNGLTKGLLWQAPSLRSTIRPATRYNESKQIKEGGLFQSFCLFPVTRFGKSSSGLLFRRR